MSLSRKDRGGGGGGGGGVQRVIDGTPANLPAAAASQLLKLAPDNRGKVRTLVEIPHQAVVRSGDFTLYGPTHFRGPFYYAPFPGTDTQDVFYSTAHEYFARVTLVSANNYQWRGTSIIDALGANAIWLGHVAHRAEALTNIGTFDNTKSYYAYISSDQNVMELTNSSYVAGSGAGTTYEWRSIGGDTQINTPRKIFYGAGQSERFDSFQTVGAGSESLPNPFAFGGGDADESYFGAGFDVAFTDIDDETDADIDKSFASSDNHVFAPDPGVYDLVFDAIGNQGADGDAAVRLQRIESGTDDRLMMHSTGWSGGAAIQEDATYHLEYSSLVVESGDKFYFHFTDIGGNRSVKGIMMLEKKS